MWNLKLKKYITLFICIILMIGVTSGCSNNLITKTNTPYDEINNFLEQNYASVDINKENYGNGFSIMDSDIDKSKIILAGEAHAISANYKLRLALLKHLNQKDNVRYLLAETGYSSSCYINDYLKSGDEAKLKLVYNNLEGTSNWNKESYNFWIKLRNYNLTLIESQRIKVIGIDIEHQTTTACEYLDSILPNNDPPKEIQLTIEKFTYSYNLKDGDAVAKAVKDLQSDINATPTIYNKYLGSNYFDFSIVVDNIINALNVYASNGENSNKIRELSIYSNFKRIYSHFPVGKYFGQFGMNHVYQKTCSSFMGTQTRFAMYLNSGDSPVNGKVLSIAYGYENCTYITTTKNSIENGADAIINDINILDKCSKTDITLFKLNGANSPFNNKTYFVKGPNGGCTTDYFQYIILIKNSKGTVPLEKL